MSKLDKVTIETEYKGLVKKWGSLMDKWDVVIGYNGKSLGVPFYMGTGHNGNEPGVEDVLSSLFPDANLGQYDFEEFCANLGLDPHEDIGAEGQYEECREIDVKLDNLFGLDRVEIEEEVRDY